MNYKIEEETIDSVKDYVRVNVIAMKQAYKDFVNKEFLNLINSEEEIKKTIEKHIIRLDDKCDKSYILYVDEKPAGILRIGASRNKNYINSGELRAIYLLDDYKKLGLGKILFKKAINELINMGYEDMILECLKLNPTNGFYRYMGGKIVDESKVNMLEQILDEYVYYYDFKDFLEK